MVVKIVAGVWVMMPCILQVVSDIQRNHSPPSLSAEVALTMGQYIPLKCWQLTTRLHSVTTAKTIIPKRVLFTS
jgi:hypothetical protein